MKKALILFLILSLTLAGCEQEIDAASSQPEPSSSSSVPESTEETSSVDSPEVAEWIHRRMAALKSTYNQTFVREYTDIDDVELVFVDLGDDDVPDMMLRFKQKANNNNIYPSILYFKYDDNYFMDHPVVVGDILDNEEPGYLCKLVEREGLMASLCVYDDWRGYDYYDKAYGENNWFDINTLPADAFTEDKMTSTYSFTDLIFNKKEMYGCYALTSNSQALFSLSASEYIPPINNKQNVESKTGYDADLYVEECKEYYCEETGLYEMYAVGKGIVELLTGRTDYPFSCFEADSFYLLPKSDYEKLYADYLAQFTEVEFPWIYRSGWKEGGFTEEWLNQVAKEANESYEAYLSKK